VDGILVSTTTATATCLADVETAAAAALAPEVWDFVAGGSGDERGLAANLDALRSVRVVPRVMRDVSERSAAGTLLGRPVSSPLVVAPVAYQALLHPDGELATARACARVGVPFTVPMLSSVPIETVAGSGAELWLQLYWLRDRRVTAELIERAVDAGATAVVLTVDVPIMGRRLRDVRNGFALPSTISAVHLAGTAGRPEGAAAGIAAQRRRSGSSAVAAHTAAAFDPTLSWADLEWIRSHTSLPLVLKGVLHPDDARLAVEAGADAVVVSNHGGRQLDTAVSGATVLPEVRAAVGDRCAVLLDGGVRSGSDIVTALALGADAVMVGRPAMWGLGAGGAGGAGGEAGVTEVLGLLATELDTAMALSGCATLDDVRRLRTVTAPTG
jgi:4-hydroxymandelate oxidase